MAKKAAPTKKAQGAQPVKSPVAAQSEAVRICYERIIPEDIAKKAGKSPFDSQSRMALIKGKLWTSGQILRCRFLHGDPKVQKKVEEVAHLWEKHANVKFKFVKTGPAEIPGAISG